VNLVAVSLTRLHFASDDGVVGGRFILAYIAFEISM